MTVSTKTNNKIARWVGKWLYSIKCTSPQPQSDEHNDEIRQITSSEHDSQLHFHFSSSTFHQNTDSSALNSNDNQNKY